MERYTQQQNGIWGLRGGSDTLPQALERLAKCENLLADLEEEIERTRERIHTLRRKQESVLARVGDARLSELLRLYYQCSFTWAETADHMGYSERQIMRLHRLALERVQKILQEDSECHLAS